MKSSYKIVSCLLGILYIECLQSRLVIPIPDSSLTQTPSKDQKDAIKLLKDKLSEVVMYYRYKEMDPNWEPRHKIQDFQKVKNQVSSRLLCYLILRRSYFCTNFVNIKFSILAGGFNKENQCFN